MRGIHVVGMAMNTTGIGSIILRGIHVVDMTMSAVEVRSLIQKGIPVVGMTMNMVESEADMRVPGEHLAGLTGMMGNGNGKILLEGTVSLVLDIINLHHPLCFLVPHLMHDWLLHGQEAILLILLLHGTMCLHLLFQYVLLDLQSNLLLLDIVEGPINLLFLRELQVRMRMK